MNSPIAPENIPASTQPDADEVPLVRSVGQILHDHLEEIVGPETATRYRQRKEVAA